MAIKTFNTGRTSIETTAQVKLRNIPKALREPPGGLYPMRLASFVADEYRIANGWPVSVPDCDVRARVLTSAQGLVLADREDAGAVETSAYARWFADVDTYNSTTLQWVSTSGAAVKMDAFTPNEPTLIQDYQYRLGKEVFEVPALVFDSDSGDYLRVEMPSLAGSMGYSVVLVGSISSVTVPYSGLWCPDGVNDNYMSVTLQGNTLYLETEQTPRQKVLSLANLLASGKPLMLAMVFSRPYAKFYAGLGPSGVISNSVFVGEQSVSLEHQNLVGRTAEDLEHTTNMALMDFGIYANVLSKADVRDEFAALSAAYGGDK